METACCVCSSSTRIIRHHRYEDNLTINYGTKGKSCMPGPGRDGNMAMLVAGEVLGF